MSISMVLRINKLTTLLQIVLCNNIIVNKLLYIEDIAY